MQKKLNGYLEIPTVFMIIFNQIIIELTEGNRWRIINQLNRNLKEIRDLSRKLVILEWVR